MTAELARIYRLTRGVTRSTRAHNTRTRSPHDLPSTPSIHSCNICYANARGGEGGRTVLAPPAPASRAVGSQMAYAPGPGVPLSNMLSLKRDALPNPHVGAVRPRVDACEPMDEERA